MGATVGAPVTGARVEVVGRAQTLFDITLCEPTATAPASHEAAGLLHYITQHNPSATLEAQRRLSRSLAFWVVLTFLLGVGDRHLHNVMVRPV